MLSGSEKGFRLMWSNREFKLHVYGKRQTSESIREFLKNRKWADKNSSNKLRETTHLGECRKNSKRGNLVCTWHKFTFDVWRERDA